MVSSGLSSLVCVLCVVVVPAVRGEYCSSYWDMNGVFHDPQQCGMMYCCGDCSRKYCCYDMNSRFHEKYGGCPERPVSGKGSHTAMVLGSILGTIFPILLCVGLIICCVAPCCFCYKKCRKGGNRRHITVVNNTNRVNTPDHPFLPSGYPSGPGYGGPSMPTAPPSYMESNDPAHIPFPFSQGQPMYPLQPPSQPYVPPPYSNEHVQPPYSNEHVQPPYNPSYP